MRVGLNAAFLLLMAGVLAIYCEFLRPGRLLPGLMGSVMAITGAYWLWRSSPEPVGVLLIVLAVLGFVVETVWDAHLIPGIFGIVCLVGGFWILFRPPQRIAPGLTVPVSILFGAVSIFLASRARRARRNKRSDI